MTIRIIIILVLQTLALAGMVGMKQWTLNTGTPVLLETQPVDPRSLFRGDYVRLRYKISSLDLDKLDGDDDFERYDSVYVVLEQEGNYWVARSAYHDRPQASAAQVVIRGEVRYTRKSWWNRETRKSEKANLIDVRYGIENYFVPEGRGRILERRTVGNKVDIRVAVDRFGGAGIKAVVVNGEEKYVETLF